MPGPGVSQRCTAPTTGVCHRLPMCGCPTSTHMRDYTNKIRADLKAYGRWVADPRKGVPTPAPSLGVKECSMLLVEGAFHCWSPTTAPLPLGTVPKWKVLMGTHAFELTTDKGVLFDPASWSWSTPTWMVLGFSSKSGNEFLERLI